MSEPTTNNIETWAIVEIMGHNRAVGFVKTEAFGGTVMLRVDTPALPERTREKVSQYDREGVWSEEPHKYQETLPAEDGYTQWVGMSSIFRLTPCTEETARNAIDKMRREPPRLTHIGPAIEQKQLAGATNDNLASEFDPMADDDGT